jgi:uncharacterized protein YfeS
MNATEKTPCSSCGHPILPITSSLTGGLCRPCANRRAWQARAAQSTRLEEDEWELSRETAHASAREALAEDFFWDIADEGAPLGSDTGSDTLAAFREWREEHPRANPERFLKDLFAGWGVKVRVIKRSAESIATALQEDHFSLLAHDDAVIALAFAQFVLEGRIAVGIREEAIAAAERQKLPEVLAFRGWTNPDERILRLQAMKRVLIGIAV